MRWRNGAALLLVAAVAPAVAAPPDLDIPGEVRPGGQYVQLSPKTTAKSVVYVGLDGVDPLPSGLLKDPRLFVLDTRGMPAGRYRFAAVATLGDEQTRADFAVVVGTPPAPPGPTPPGPINPNDPLTSFRVFLITSGQTTPDQNAVLYGKAVEDWLNTNCTGGKAGWRRRDKDAPGDADPATAALWAAIQPKVTQTPCIAVERNTKVDILPLGATPEAMLATLKQYRGGN